jgi:class 3 adenylate cyclase/tetratricopeptide (TPR) repeat protein
MNCQACGAANPEQAKFCLECGAPLAAQPSREVRKTVTVVFCDVTGSTALGASTDPEAVRALLARYFDRMRGIIEAHGGAVEKFIGDAVMAVFGVPVVHEDDALRAVRAALEMRDAMPELGIEARIGVNTGEVVAGTAERLATGDAVNVAARLEQAAEPGQVLIGAETLRLVRDAVEVGPSVALTLKGKDAPVEAHPLLALTGRAGVERRLVGSFVGRERERRLLAEAFDLAVSDRACHLFTLLGVAGVGKSRLAAEFLQGLDATIVRGRCLSYGDGITYFPVLEIVQLLRPDERELEPNVARPLRTLLGGSEPATADEIAYAVRKLLEEAAGERPLVVVWDDLHWGEPTFLDLVEHIADWSRDAPVLLLCLARPELLDARPGWGGGKLRATTVLVEPLGRDACEALLDDLEADLSDDLRTRILASADGNPLFVEEMVAMVRESPGEDVQVPPTISALLAARLDQLAAPERAALERGSVEGAVFHRTAVEALDGDPAQILRLVRKELVRPDKATLPGDDAFRFRHILIRDAAYEALPKSTRAMLHERFADWLEQRAPDLVELDEMVGYHLEQATRYRLELGALTEHDRAVAARAAERLQLAGDRALFRDDPSASARLLERGLSLLDPEDRRPEREWRLARALLDSGALKEAAELSGNLAEAAAARGDRRRELYARLTRGSVVFLGGIPEGEGAMQHLAELSAEARGFFEERNDDLGLAIAWFVLAHVHHNKMQWQKRHDALTRSLEHAQRAGDAYLIDLLSVWLAAGYVFGPMTTDVAVRWFEDQDLSLARPHLLMMQGQIQSMVGNFDRAEELLGFARSRFEELGQSLMRAASGMPGTLIAARAGDYERAAEEAVDGCLRLQALGERGWLSTCACYAAEALFELGQDDEAERWIAVADEIGGEDDVITQTLIRQVRGLLAARAGRHAAAEALIGDALELIEQTDAVEGRAEAQIALGKILRLAGREAEALEALGRAEALFEQKRHLAGLALVRKQLAATPS